MSSSHLFFGLPIALLVLFLELSSGFHSAAFLIHLSLGDVAILNANFQTCKHEDGAPRRNTLKKSVHRANHFRVRDNSVLVVARLRTFSFSHTPFPNAMKVRYGVAVAIRVG